jgi:hypothetical protein
MCDDIFDPTSTARAKGLPDFGMKMRDEKE